MGEVKKVDEMRIVGLLSLFLAASASAAQAFEVDLSRSGVARAKGNYLLEDLTVAAKGRVFRNSPCVVDGALMLSEQTEILSDGHFVVSRKPTGNFSLTFEPLDYNDKPKKKIYSFERPAWFSPCSAFSYIDPATLVPVDDIDGFTKYSEWVDYVLKKFELND